MKNLFLSMILVLSVSCTAHAAMTKQEFIQYILTDAQAKNVNVTGVVELLSHVYDSVVSKMNKSQKDSLKKQYERSKETQKVNQIHALKRSLRDLGETDDYLNP